MIIKTALLYSFLIAIFSFKQLNAETINISGKVQNQSGSPVINAEVILLSNSNISTNTDSDGKFNLSGQITAIGSFNSRFTPSVSIRGSNIQVILRKSSPVSMF